MRFAFRDVENLKFHSFTSYKENIVGEGKQFFGYCSKIY
jgi:hypothetical protein